MSKVLLNIPDEYLRAVDEAAQEQHRTRSELIREAVRAYYCPRRTEKEQARIEKVGKEIEKLRAQWKGPLDSAKVIRKMRDGR